MVIPGCAHRTLASRQDGAGKVNAAKERASRPQGSRDGRMKSSPKTDLPVSQIRRFLEPGPIVLVSSAWRGQTNIMTLGWHTVMEFEPSRIGCYIWDQNHSFGLIRASKQCVI